MANTIDQTFITDYDSEVHAAYQQFGSKLRNCVRLKQLNPGQVARFPTLGKGTATDKARNGDVVPMNPTHSYKEATATDKYAPEYIDKLDDIKNNIEERALYARAGANALGREVDSRITTALNAVTTNVIADGSTGLTVYKLLLAMSKLNAKDVPDDGERWGVLGAQQWEEFLAIARITSADYVTGYPTMKGTQIVNWRGIKWFYHSNLPTSSSIRSCFLFHKNSVGLAENKSITTEINYVPQKAAFLVNSMMSCGVVVIDEEGIVKISCSEAVTTALV